jgi:hypothetical protein
VGQSGALEASGKDIDRLAPDDLAAVDEFHIGGRQATVDFATQALGQPYIYSILAAAWVGLLVISLMNAAAE